MNIYRKNYITILSVLHLLLHVAIYRAFIALIIQSEIFKSVFTSLLHLCFNFLTYVSTQFLFSFWIAEIKGLKKYLTEKMKIRVLCLIIIHQGTAQVIFFWKWKKILETVQHVLHETYTCIFKFKQSIL